MTPNREWRHSHPQQAKRAYGRDKARRIDKMFQAIGGRKCIVPECETPLNHVQPHHTREKQETNANKEYEIINNPKGVIPLCYTHHKAIHEGNAKTLQILRRLEQFGYL